MAEESFPRLSLPDDRQLEIAMSLHEAGHLTFASRPADAREVDSKRISPHYLSLLGNLANNQETRDILSDGLAEILQMLGEEVEYSHVVGVAQASRRLVSDATASIDGVDDIYPKLSVYQSVEKMIIPAADCTGGEQVVAVGGVMATGNTVVAETREVFGELVFNDNPPLPNFDLVALAVALDRREMIYHEMSDGSGGRNIPVAERVSDDLGVRVCSVLDMATIIKVLKEEAPEVINSTANFLLTNYIREYGDLGLIDASEIR